MSFDLVYVSVRYSPQHNSKVGRKSFDNFRLPQANYNKYFLNFHFLSESILFDFLVIFITRSVQQRKVGYFFKSYFKDKLTRRKNERTLIYVNIVLYRK